MWYRGRYLPWILTIFDDCDGIWHLIAVLLPFHHGNPSCPARKKDWIRRCQTINGGLYRAIYCNSNFWLGDVGGNFWEIGICRIHYPAQIPNTCHHLFHFFPPPFHPISLRMPRLQKYHMHAIEAKSLASFLLPMFLGSPTFFDAGNSWCLKACPQKQYCSFISHCVHKCWIDFPAIQTCCSMKLILDWAVQTPDRCRYIRRHLQMHCISVL